MKLTGLQGFLLTFTGLKVVLCLTKAGFSWVALLQVAGTAGFGSSLQAWPTSALYMFILGSRLSGNQLCGVCSHGT